MVFILWIVRQMEQLVNSLAGGNWLEAATKIEEIIKPQIQKPKGLIRDLRVKLFEDIRKREIINIEASFCKNPSTNNLDDRINTLANEIYGINQTINQTINLNFGSLALEHLTPDEKRGEAWTILRLLKNNARNDPSTTQRLQAIVNKIVTISILQSRKANAGAAGEIITNCIIRSAGLEEGVHYKRQYQSDKKEGSITDFVFPYIEDGQEQKIDTFLAVQFSTNDRARMVESELKPGGNIIFLTGSGLEVASKKLGAISADIQKKISHNNCQWVCYKPELEAERARLRAKPNDTNKTKLDNLNSAITYEDFANVLKKKKLGWE